jgi:hypothetical protein
MAMYNNSHSSTKGLQSVQASCDKLVLWTSNFEIEPKAKLTLNLHSVDLSTDEPKERFPLYHDTDGRPIYGQKAFSNNDFYQLDIETVNGSPLLNLQFNPNKVGQSGHYYQPTTDTAQRNAQIRLVNDAMQKDGIHFDFENARVKRGDFAKDRFLPDPLSAHGVVFQSLSAKRGMNRKYLDTYYLGNKQWQNATYDKGLQLNIPGVVNLTRNEMKALRGRTCQSIYGITTLADVLKTDVETFTERYNEALIDKIFHNRSASGHTNTSEIVKLSYYIDKHGQSGFGRYLQNTGIPQAINSFGSLEAMLDVIGQFHSRQTVHKWRKKLIDNYAEHIHFCERAESETARLYDNLYSFAI